MTKKIQTRVSGTWQQVKDAFVRVSGSWVPSKKVFVKIAGVWTQVFPEQGTQSYTAPGTFSFMVPFGVRTLTVDQSGASGAGAGGSQAGAGSTGQNGYRDTRTVTVTPGETITVYVGAKALGGRSAACNCGSNGANYFAIDADPNNRRGLGGTTGFGAGTNGAATSCSFSFAGTGGWSGGGGASSAIVGSFGTVIAGGGNGGTGSANASGVPGPAGGTGANNGSGNQGATGVAPGAGQGPSCDAGYGDDGLDGYVTLSWGA